MNDVFFSPGDDCLQQIQHQIQQARQNIAICVFTISDDRIAREIVSAHKRNISIKIITDNDKQYDLGSDIQKFIKEKIPVKLDNTRYHMHHKFAVFDREKVITGSYNWTRSAAEYNEENIICSNDPAMVLPFLRQFDKMWNELEFANNR
ncbi:UNVERIFIED_CONTAM: hypothetical protein GTU68_029998 [Idotea baltica]|nr:hypothetical protein [Idotea baltica]